MALKKTHVILGAVLVGGIAIVLLYPKIRIFQTKRLLLKIWKLRFDLQKAFPEASGGDYRRMAGWALDRIVPGNVDQQPEFMPYRSELIKITQGA